LVEQFRFHGTKNAVLFFKSSNLPIAIFNYNIKVRAWVIIFVYNILQTTGRHANKYIKNRAIFLWSYKWDWMDWKRRKEDLP